MNDQDQLRMLVRDYNELLFLLIDQFMPGQIHKDTRCMKGPVPHVITVECTHLPERP